MNQDSTHEEFIQWLRCRVANLNRLLNENYQPGLTSWQIMFGAEMKAISRYWNEGFPRCLDAPVIVPTHPVSDPRDLY